MRYTRHNLSRIGLAFAAIPAALWIGCSTDKPTELVSGVTSQMQVPKDLAAVGFIAQRVGGQAVCNSYPVDVVGEAGFVNLPRTLATDPLADPKIPVTISILGFKRNPGDQFSTTCLISPKDYEPGAGLDAAVILRRARMPYVSNKILYLPMPLREACNGVVCPDESTTCKAGKCVKMDIDPTKLVAYSDNLVYGTNNTCFTVGESDAQQKRGAFPCFAPLVTLPARPFDPETCTYDVPVPAPDQLPPGVSVKGVNVRITHANFNTEVLDIEDPAVTPPDDQEGFTIPDPAQPFRFKLAPNLCSLVRGEVDAKGVRTPPRIIGVSSSFVCKSKTALQPICKEDLATIQQKGSTDPGDPSGYCVEPLPLRPSPSRLYIVMDRSKSMEPFFGAKGVEGLAALKEYIGAALQDPALRATEVAFQFLPAAQTECTTSPTTYASPGSTPGSFPFKPAETARTDITNEIGKESNVIANDPPVLLDAVMKPSGGAYAALPPPPGDTRFLAERALLIIGNRDFASGCGGTETPADHARAAAAANSRTYVVMLGRRGADGLPIATTGLPVPSDPTDPKEVERAGHVRAIENAKGIADAAGTKGRFFNVAASPAEGAKAFPTIVGDLASCVYDPVLSLPETAAERAAFRLAYLSFDSDGISVTRKRTEITYNPACAEGVPGVSGWSVEPSSRVRICGEACTALRDSLVKSSIYASTASPPQPPDGIDIRVARPCTQP